MRYFVTLLYMIYIILQTFWVKYHEILLAFSANILLSDI